MSARGHVPRRPRPPLAARPAAARARAPGAAAGLQGAAGFSPLPVQRKLNVGAPGDPYEREADQVADRVVRGEPAPAISHLPASGLPKAAQTVPAETTTGMEEEKTAETAQTKSEPAEEETAQRQAAEEDMLAEGAETAQTQAQNEEEVQAGAAEEIAQAETEEAEPVQAETEEPEPVQTETEGEEEETAQTKRASSVPATRPDQAEAERAIRNPGPGSPLPGEVRQRIEGSTGADLSDVRVHDDRAAERASQSLDARAFAHGRDIWLGPGESTRDSRLLAHEASHVVQQTGRGRAALGGPSPIPPSSGRAPAVQRTDGPPPLTNRSEIPGSVLDMASKSLTIDKLSLPTVARAGEVPFPAKAQKPGARDTNQRLYWLQQIEIADQGVEAATPDDKSVSLDIGGKHWFLRLANSKNFLIGTRETLKTSARLPNWKDNGVLQNFQVDHIREDQLGGADAIDNYQLLDPETNRAKGNAIRQEIRNRIRTAMAAHMAKNPTPASGTPDPFSEVRRIHRDADEIRATLNDVTFQSKDASKIDVAGPALVWTVDQIRNGKHLRALTPTVDASIRPPLGTSAELVVLPGEAGGAPVKIPLKDNAPQLKATPYFGGVNNLVVIGATYAPSSLALAAKFIVKGKIVQDIDAPMTLQALGNPFTFQLPTDLMQTGLERRLELAKASPVTVEQASITGGELLLKGQLDFSSKLFKEAKADLMIRGEEVYLSKTFAGGEFDLPGPIDITDSSLTVSLGVTGGNPNLMVEGSVGFEEQRIGKGVLRGMGGVTTGIAVEGEFDFDPALFRGANARIRIRYAEDKFSGEGVVGIADGQIEGIRSAELTVRFEDSVWTAEGTVVPKIPGVNQGSLSMVFNPEGGFEITGRLTFGEGVPRLKSGYLEATLKKEDEAYILSGKGSAELDIPGITSAITAEYRDGLFKAEGTLGFERGIARGTVTVGATNMPVDEGGAPVGEPGEQVSIYGQGSVTIRFTPWLEGTAGIKVKPDGQVEVSGRVALPDSVEVFPQKLIERELLSIGVDIPVVGVAVAGQRIGIFLNIGGNLTARASVGPGTLEDVAVEVVYNPEDEAATRVTGTARFVVPAEAGLRLGIRGAIGAGIPVVSVQAGLELGGQLGVEGEAAAATTLEWSPAAGISMEADLSLLAQPKFTFDITGFVEVTADLLLTEIDLYSKRWQLASIEFGSNMQVGARMRVKVENGAFKPISVDDIEFITPQIDPLQTVRGLLQAL